MKNDFSMIELVSQKFVAFLVLLPSDEKQNKYICICFSFGFQNILVSVWFSFSNVSDFDLSFQNILVLLWASDIF